MDLSASALGYAQVQAEHHHLPVDFILGDILSQNAWDSSLMSLRAQVSCIIWNRLRRA